MNVARRPALVDNRAVLAAIPGRLVRAVIREDSPYADAMIAILLERAYDWSLEEWNRTLDALAASRLTVGEWLIAQHEREAA